MDSQQVLAAHAAYVASEGQPGGLFLLAWGLIASMFGLLAVTNFRGFADAVTRAPVRTVRSRRSLSGNPDDMGRRNKALIKIIGGLFAVLGPVMTVAGIVTSLRGHFAIPEGPAMPVPFRYLFLAVVAFSLASGWIPRLGGYMLSAARQSGWRRTVALFATAGGVTFAVCVAYGRMTIGIAVLLASGLPAFLLFLGHSHAKRGS